MSVSLEETRKIALLAKLDFTDDELNQYREHLNEVLTYVEKLNELDTDKVEPTYYVQTSKDAMREDKTTPSLSLEDVMKNAPKHRHGFFRVPKVIQSDGGNT
ncbi:Asp-tRNA(Asn)/Glu-tRNA(Gln) amidotransferase subunit GatC [bacterium]